MVRQSFKPPNLWNFLRQPNKLTQLPPLESGGVMTTMGIAHVTFQASF